MRYLSVLLICFSSLIFSQQVTLRDTTNEFDYVIVTIPEFKPVCEPFKQHKQSMFGFKVLIVDTGMIYNEFNSYTKKEDNIREFISYAGTFWRYPQPKYFLLAGDLSKVPNHELIYTLGGVVTDTANTDHYYSYSSFSLPSDSCKFAVGRVPARTLSDLSNYLNKVTHYESDTTFLSWMSRNLFFSQYDTLVNNIFENIATYLMSILPNHLTNKFFTENISSPNYGTKDSLFNYINAEGILTLWLIGASNDFQFTRTPLFTIQDLDLIANGFKNFFTFFLDRQRFGRNPWENSIANKLVTDENASIGVISRVGVGYAFDTVELLSTFSLLTLGSNNYAIGNALIRTKNISSYQDMEVLLNLWGDPSLKLKFDPTTSIGNDELENPSGFALLQNYPNPFNPSTRISFTLQNASDVQIKIFDILGNEVAVLANEFYEAGFHSVEFSVHNVGRDLSSGVYFYTIKAGDFIQSKKMLYLK